MYREPFAELHRYSDADFVGKILSRRVMPGHDDLDFDRVLLEVRVIESFRGAQKAGWAVAWLAYSSLTSPLLS